MFFKGQSVVTGHFYQQQINLIDLALMTKVFRDQTHSALSFSLFIPAKRQCCGVRKAQKHITTLLFQGDCGEVCDTMQVLKAFTYANLPAQIMFL